MVKKLKREKSRYFTDRQIDQTDEFDLNWKNENTFDKNRSRF